jgi:uncharacterized membrane protein YuzA (DUF378 family)
MIADNILVTSFLITGIFLFGIAADFYGNSSEETAMNLVYFGLIFIGISALTFFTSCGKSDQRTKEEKQQLIQTV